MRVYRAPTHLGYLVPKVPLAAPKLENLYDILHNGNPKPERPLWPAGTFRAYCFTILHITLNLNRLTSTALNTKTLKP